MNRRLRSVLMLVLLATSTPVCLQSMELISERFAFRLLEDATPWQAFTAVDHGNHQAVVALNQLLRSGECVLNFRQAEFAYYGRGCYRSYLDHRLVPLYHLQAPEAARAYLIQQRIRYLLLPDSGMPEIYNTALEGLVTDSHLAELVWEFDGYQIYRLIENVGAARESPEIVKHFDQDELLIRHPNQPTVFKRGGWRPLFPLRSAWLVAIHAPLACSEIDPNCVDNRRLEAPELLRICTQLAGNGYVRLNLKMRAKSKFARRTWPYASSVRHVWDGVVKEGRRACGLVVREPGNPADYVIVLSVEGPARIEIKGLAIDKLPLGEDLRTRYSRNEAALEGWLAYSGRRDPRTWPWGKAKIAGREVAFLSGNTGQTFTLAGPPTALPNGEKFLLAGTLESSVPVDVYIESLSTTKIRRVRRWAERYFGFLFPADIIGSGTFTWLPTKRSAPYQYKIVNRSHLGKVSGVNGPVDFTIPLPAYASRKGLKRVLFVVMGGAKVKGRDDGEYTLTVRQFTIKKAS